MAPFKRFCHQKGQKSYQMVVFAVTPFPDMGEYSIQHTFDRLSLEELYWMGELPVASVINRYLRNYFQRFLTVPVPKNTKAVVDHQNKTIRLVKEEPKVAIDYSCITFKV